MSAQNADEQQKKKTRRSFLKWSAALAVAGAAVVGIGTGYGADILLRPTTEKKTTETVTKTIGQTATQVQTSTQTVTATTTATQTVTQPPATLSYIPPLSPQVQATVDQTVKGLVARHSGDQIINAPCSYRCTTSCMLRMHVKNGVLTAVETDVTYSNAGRESTTEADLAIAKVNLRACTPVRAMRRHLYDPNRILYPMQRVPGTKRGDPQFTRITWDDALKYVANKITALKDKYGPYFFGGGYMLYPTNEIYRLMSLVGTGAGVGGWGAASTDALSNARRIALGVGSTASFNDLSDMVKNSKLIICIGATPSMTVPKNQPYWFILAKEKGIPIIFVEPMYTRDAESLGSQWLPIRPGTDGALLIAMANVIVKAGTYNKTFVDKYVSGFDKWSDYLLGKSDGVDKSPAWAETITGIPADTITALANLYVKSGPVFLFMGWGAVRKSYGELTSWAGLALQAIMGYVGVPGGLISLDSGVPGVSASANSTQQTYGAWGPKPPEQYRLHKFPDYMLRAPLVASGQLARKDFDKLVGNTTPNLPLANIKMIWHDRSNGIVTGAGNSFRYEQAINMLDFFVCREAQMTTMAKFADMILPCTDYLFENYQMISSSNYLSAVCYVPKVVNPPGEAKTPGWILTQLAYALGIGQKYNPLYTQGSSWDDFEISQCQSAYATYAANMKAKGFTVPAWADFVKSPLLTYQSFLGTPYYYDIKADIDAGKLKLPLNPSGKIQVYSDFLATTDPMTPFAIEGSRLQVNGYPLPPSPQYVPMKRGVFDPLTSKYPITLVTPHSSYRQHSYFWHNDMLNGDVYRHAIHLSVADAQARGIKDGDMVRVYNETGETTVAAYVTSRIVPGVACLRMGGWFDNFGTSSHNNGDANGLMEPLDGSPHVPFHVCTVVQVEAL